jgi:hypothetical protein
MRMVKQVVLELEQYIGTSFALNVVRCTGFDLFFMFPVTMSSKPVSWDRFVRYIAQGSDQTVRYGDPIVSASEANFIAQMAEEGRLEVMVLQGDDPLSASLGYPDEPELLELICSGRRG